MYIHQYTNTKCVHKSHVHTFLFCFVSGFSNQKAKCKCYGKWSLLLYMTFLEIFQKKILQCKILFITGYLVLWSWNHVLARS